MTDSGNMSDYQYRVYSALTEIYKGRPVTTEDIRIYLTGEFGYTAGKKVGNTLARLRDLGFVEGEGGQWEPKYTQ